MAKNTNVIAEINSNNNPNLDKTPKSAFARKDEDPAYRRTRKLLRELAKNGNCEAVCIFETENGMKVEGTKFLKRAVRNLKGIILKDLDEAIQKEKYKNSCLSGGEIFKLIEKPLHDMTSQELRSLIPKLVKSTTGRASVGWGWISKRPPWWPKDVPFLSVRNDVRKGEEKKEPFKSVLLRIAKSCFSYYERKNQEGEVIAEMEIDKENNIISYERMDCNEDKGPDNVVEAGSGQVFLETPGTSNSIGLVLNNDNVSINEVKSTVLDSSNRVIIEEEVAIWHINLFNI